ncbi:MAG: histone deacetylase [Gammaproteobacteria bacterium]|nr:histone deacetylase [Gammaproteobacteria bacterium]
MKISYQHDYYVQLPEGHPFPMGKFPALYEMLLDRGVTTPEETQQPEEASRELLSLAHQRDYLDKLFGFSLSVHEERKIGLPWTEALLVRSRRAVTGTLLAARAALEDGMAGNCGGGTHHAMPDHGRGFCIFNDVAIAAKQLLDEGLVGRVLIIDLDVHQGDGTATIFRDEPRVFTFSMHGDRNYPARKPPSDVDVALPEGTTDFDYLDTLRMHLPEVIRRAQPDIVFYLGGVDVHADARFGHFELSEDGIRRRDRYVIESIAGRGLPLVLTLAGGYAATPERTAELHAIMCEEALAWQQRQGRVRAVGD